MDLRTASLVMATLVVSLALLPMAAATHEYGHRYIVMGVLIDAEGNPVQHQDVRITTSLGDQIQAEIVTRTDCVGQFYSPDGFSTQRGPMWEVSYDGKTYFHYHDAELTSRIRVELSALGETWTAPFETQMRTTVSRHSLAQTVPASEECAEGFDPFHANFTVKVTLFTDGEGRTFGSSGSIPPRAVVVELAHAGGTSTRNGTTDTNGKVWAVFQDVEVRVGDTYTIQSSILGNRTNTVTQEDLDYRFAAQSYRRPDASEGGFPWRGLLIVLAIGAAGLAGFVGYHKMRDRIELKKAYNQTGRKRARRKS